METGPAVGPVPATLLPAALPPVLLRRDFLHAERVLGGPAGRRELPALLVLTAAADALLFRTWGGTGLAALGLVALAVLGALARGAPHAGGAAWLFGALAILASLRSAWQAGAPATALWAVSLAGFAVAMRSRRAPIATVLRLVPLLALAGGHRLFLYLRTAAEWNAARPRKLRVRTVLVPAGIALAFLLIFAQANPVLARWADAWRGALDVTPGRVLFWLACVWIAAALLRPVGQAVRIGAPGGALEEWLRAKGVDDCAMAFGTLAAVNLVFLAFNALDFGYLWLHAKLPEGITYSEYSHRGVAWLTLALALSSLVLGGLFSGPLRDHPRRGRLVAWAHAWAAQNLVLAAGTFRRIQMYVDYNGLTRLRVVGIAGTALVVAGLLLMAWKVHRGKGVLWLLRCDIAALFVALSLLALLPIDAIVSRFNAGRALAGNLKPLVWIAEQPISDEGLPPILSLLEHRDPAIRTGVAAFLHRRLDRMPRQAPAASWTLFQGARASATNRLGAARERLEALSPPSRTAEDEQSFLRLLRPWRD